MPGATPSFRIKRIKEVIFYINENLFVDDPQRKVNIDLKPLLGHNVSDNSIVVIIRVFFHYEGVDPLPENTLVEIQVQNLYEFDELRSFINESNLVILPEQTIVELMALSISHTRALAAKAVAGTSYENFLLPAFDSDKAARLFFGYMFGSPGRV
jgi:hypothetical protein